MAFVHETRLILNKSYLLYGKIPKMCD